MSMSVLIPVAVALPVSAVWLCGWALTARALFRAWRPSRTPICTPGDHISSSSGTGHTKYCFRRRKPDLSRSEFDSDAEAAGMAMFTAILWFPFLAAAMFIRHNPPELDAEKDSRLKALMKRNAQLERDLERKREPRA